MSYLLIGLLLYILWRLVMGFPAPGKKLGDKGGESQDSSVSEELVRDPVCGMYIPGTTALKMKKKGETLYFCGKECQKKFLDKSN